MKPRGFWNLIFTLPLLGVVVGCGSGSSGSQQQQNPVPTLSGVSPNSATAGSTAFTLTASGSGFISSSVIEWNGVALNTTYASSTSLSAQVPASDVTLAGTANITVQNPSPGGGTSHGLTFAINMNPASLNLNIVDLEGADVAWDPNQQKLYVAVPSGATSNGSTITVVDPIAGSITGSQQLPSAPSGLAISDDNHYLYAVINGGASIQRLILPALTPDIQWSLGTNSNTGNPYLAGDIKAQPGSAQTLAVSMGDFGSGQVAIFDNAIERAAVGGGSSNDLGNSLQWKADGSALFSAYTQINDSPYYTTVSDDALYIVPVNAAGAGTTTKYDSTFRREGAHLHLDATTGYAYGDWGEVVNGGNGIPVGNYRYSRPLSTYFPGPLSVVDPTLKRFYTLLEINEANGIAFQIQTFDQTQFRLLSTIVIPGATGVPTNFIRWGQAGLAFVTNGLSSSGKLYILDGNFVNPSASPDTSAGSQLTAVPTLTSASPLTAIAGSSGITLTVGGRDFSDQSTLFWNGSPIPTTLVNGGQLSGQVPASDLASVGMANITAANGTASSPASNALPVAVNDSVSNGNQVAVFDTGGNDLVWDATAQKIYVSMPGIQGDAGDAIGIVDPVAGTATSPGFLGSDPARLSLSDNGQYLYVALNGQNSISQLKLPSFNVNASWNLGGNGKFFGPYYALDVEAEPGSAQTTAVILANFDISPSPAAVAIYDGATARPNQLQVTAYPYSSLQWAGTDPTLYATDQQGPQDFLVLGVAASGTVLNQHYDGVLNTYSQRLHYDQGTGLIYTDAGQVLQPSDGSIVGSFGASGIVVPDSGSNLVFILGQTASQTGTANYSIESFDQAKFTSIGSITIENVVGTPTALIRWGTNGLAFTTRVGRPEDFFGAGPGLLYVVSGNFVKVSEAEGRSFAHAPLLPVRRTWSSDIAFQRRSNVPVVHSSPLRH